MKSSIIILTSGMSGSSVLSGFIAQAGYWLGEETSHAPFNTYENKRLIELNLKLLKQANYKWRDVTDIPPPSIDEIESLHHSIPLDEFDHFVNECNQHWPFLWKDPRLSYTIFFWKEYLDLSTFKFLLMTRDIKQTWIGGILRAKRPIPIDKLKIIEENCIEHAKMFFMHYKINYLHVTFEDLIIKPADEISKINAFLGEKLTFNDLRTIYKGRLYSLRWSNKDYIMAKLRFAYYKYISKDVITFPRKSDAD